MAVGHGRGRRITRGVATLAIAFLVGFMAAQVANTFGVRRELVSGCARIFGEDGCEASTGVASVQLSIDATALGRDLKIERPRLDAKTSLIRQTCDGGWTFGFGARGEIAGFAVANASAAFEVDRGCIDMRRSGSRGTFANARLSSQGCAIPLDPFEFNADGPLQVRLGSAFDQPTIDACQQLLPASFASSAQLAGTRVDLETSYAVDRSIPSTQSSELARRAGTGGIVQRVLSSVPTSHTLRGIVDGSKVAVRIETEPAGDSAIVTLAVEADGAFAKQLPADVQSPASGPLNLNVRWTLDHATGMVRVNGLDISRHPLQATRPAGRVVLPVSECTSALVTRSLFFVEANDQGEALESRQLDAVFTAVDKAATASGALVAVFVHGWHHSAAPGDSYVCSFSDVLASVEEMETRAAALAGRPSREVIGVYVGWPGALYPNTLANTVTTFWNRLDAADHLGGESALLPRLLAGLSQRLAGRSSGSQADRRSSLLLVGHSMGARAVFNALRGDLLRAAPATDGPPAPDLVLLVNPAFSATLYRVVHEQSRECRPGAVPLLLFSSEADGVTRQLYPAGQTVTYPYGGAEPAPFLEHIYTAANFADFVTHRLVLEVVSGEAPAPDGPQTILRGFERTPAGSRELYSDNPVLVYRQPSVGRPRSGDVWYRMRLTDVAARSMPCEPTAGGAAVVAVDQRVLPDHGRIFTPPFVEYIVRVLNRRALASAGPR